MAEETMSEIMEIEPLVAMISSPRISEFLRRLKLGKIRLHDFKRNLLSLNAILDDAELKAYENKQVKTWVDELSEVSYDVNGLLDEISKKPPSKIWVPKFIRPEETRKQRLIAIAVKVRDLQTQGDALGLRKASQKIREPFQLSDGREDFEDESQVFGRDEDKEAILKLLFSDDNHQTHVITMVGEGGVGKTTLAQLVYNDEKVVKHFEFKAWIHVSEDFDDLLLTKAILHAFTYQSDTEDLDSHQNNLKYHLNQKKFLLVLDNLTMRSDWRNLQEFLTAGAKGSRIIVTTCHPQLQETMGTLPAFTVRSLTKEESWMLFAKHAFPDKDSSLDPELEGIRKEIVEKCRGLPLAAKMLASVLRFKPVEEWHAVLNNNMLEQYEDLITSVLKMSYNELPIHLKQCIAYCSIFPKYHEYEEDKLILLWKAEGFLQPKGGTRMEEEVGSEYFRNLTDRSFFQSSGANKSCFIMHDLLKDMIHSESGFLCSRMGNDEYSEVSSKPWHLLISGGEDISKEAKFLRTLILYKSSQEKESCQLSGEQLNNLFEALQRLRVLSLSGYDITELPDSIGKLKRLRFLDLSHTTITQLSDSVSSLYNLQTLLLSNCSCLTKLPDLFQLSNLQFLDLSHTAITELPASGWFLPQLRTLLLSNCSCLTELPNSFNNLSNLQLLDLSHTAITKLPGSVRSLYKLKKLLLSHCTRLTELPHSVQYLTNLQLLDLSHTAITEIPFNGLRYLDQLQKLLLSNCYSLTEFPDLFHLLKNLRLLDISHTAITKLPDSKSSLPDLRVLSENIGKLINLRPVDSRGEFPEVEGQEFPDSNVVQRTDVSITSKIPPPESSKRPTEDSIATYGGASDNYSAATEISSSDTDNPIDAEEILEDISSPEQESLDVSEISQLKRLPPKLYSLKIEGCDALKSLHWKLKRDNPYLQHLYIIDCQFLESIHESHLPIALKTLYISKSKKLELEFLSSEYTSIEHLCIESSCDSLESFPLSSFPKLRNLSIRDCANFTSISSGLKDHMSLDALEIRDCPKLISFLERGLRIPNLTSILLSNCKNLKELRDQLHGLTSLQSLFMKDCPELESIPGGLPSSLNLLCISSCHKLTPRVDWGLHKLNSFSCIEIEGGCRDLESFPEKNLLPMNLTSLQISRLMNLKFLDYKGLEHLTSLETLKINSCGKLQSFPAEGLPSSLSYLYISDCPLLKSKLQNRRGKEWYKIAHIPHIQIDMEVIS